MHIAEIEQRHLPYDQGMQSERPGHQVEDGQLLRLVDPSDVPERPIRRVTDRAVPVVGLLLLALSAPGVMLATVLAGSAPATSVELVAAWSLAQLPLLAYATRRHLQRSWDEPVGDVQLTMVDADEALQRTEEKLHELRATVVGLALTHRLLRDRNDELQGATRTRLEELHESEMGRLERMLADEPAREERAVDLHAVITPLAETLRLRGHAVRWEGTRARALGRPDDVAEIVHILLENAARHASGSDISVAVAPTRTGVRLQVSDRGPGVPATLAPTLFERGSRRPGSPGQGLGLHIAHRLAQEMGGHLGLEATGTAGATFTLTLPTGRGAVPCLVPTV